MSDGSSGQVISLPNGGGALNGIGEKFSPDLHTGTGNFTFPIALPPGRTGFQPELSLIYSTGNGNGPFGLGWSLSVPGVSRKTSKAIPRYDSEDVFILSGVEDLVPLERSDKTDRYRPRTEGLFARIERHRDAAKRDHYWEVRSKDGLISCYGTDPEDRPPAEIDPDWEDPAIVADPHDRDRIFAWKLTKTEDPFGNRIEYEYERDSGEDKFHRWDQLYLKRIRYADYEQSGKSEFLISVAFIYGDEPDAAPDAAPEERPDPFSDYRAGFEIRTRWRCKQINVRTHAGDDPTTREEGTLVRTYELVYLDERVAAGELSESVVPPNGVSLLSQVRATGHDESQEAEADRTEELPPLEFGYTRFESQERDLFSIEGRDLPARSLANPDAELVDLFGNGLPDFLETNGAFRYWRNLGDGEFDLPREMRDAPAGLRLADPGVQMIDADGDGRTDLLVTANGLSGYYPLRFGGLWDRRSFQRFEVAPSFDLENPEVKLVDLDGDGVTDVIRSGSRLECFFNETNGRRRGWTTEKARWVERRSLEEFPDVDFSDPRVRWADMTGDGLQDIVLIYDGHVEYWPNLGHGNWGKRVSMHKCPSYPYGYDPKRILVGDVDGDGAADIVYVDDTKVTLWINRSGNEWSDPTPIRGTPPVSDMDAVRLTDMLGTGVSGVLWSAVAGGLSRKTMFFLDFTGGAKPYLLGEMDNHMGAVTKLGYASSTRFYLEDQKRPETRWKTPLPFPVQVVSRVEVIDDISKGKLTTEYRYHHGYWDGAEREFRGFGMVERLDTETFEDYNEPGLHGEETHFETVGDPVEDPKSFSPPTLTRTWFHQGPIEDEFGEWKETNFATEFWPDDTPMFTPDDPRELLSQLPRRVRRDALRALRGRVLRTEFYALDGTEREHRPYTVEEHLDGVCEVVDEDGQHQLVCEPRSGDSPAIMGDEMPPRVFFPHTLAQRTTQWERGDDPMTHFSFTDEYDEYGQPQQQTQIACPRGWRKQEDTPGQSYLATRTRTIYARPLDSQTHIMDRVAGTITYEIKNDGAQRVSDLNSTPDDSASLEVIGQTLNFYDRDSSKPDNGAFWGLPFRQVGDYGALVRTESLVLTDETMQEAYGNDQPLFLKHTGPPVWTDEYPREFRDRLPALAGYAYQAGGAEYQEGFFAATEQRRYDFHDDPAGEGRGLIKTSRDPLGHALTITYDEPYDLLPKEVTDPVGLKTTADYDYRVLQPAEVTDPNGNRTRFTFTPLGLLKDTWVLGKPASEEGDRQRPGARMEYDFLAFAERGLPISVRTVRQVHHDTETDIPLPQRDETITTVEYSDGFGRLLQTRTQAEDIVFGEDSTFGGEVLPADQTDSGGDIIGHPVADPVAEPRVVVSGWQTYDNKGQVVEKYEPFFSEGWDYALPEDSQLGQKATMFYDPRGQVIRTLNPDGSERLVIHGVPGKISLPDLSDPEVFDPTPWEAYTYDANDNAERTHAATGYRHHWDTPANIVTDALGHTVETVERNRAKPADPADPLPPIEEYRTSSTYDIRGNLLTVTDALGRVAFEHAYDLANRPLRIESIDAGIRQTVVDAAGNVVEERDSKGALVLHAYDTLNRPTRLWARDGSDQPITLREGLIYGDGADSGRNAEQAAGANVLGKLYKHYDEAGLLPFEAHDFKGNVREKARQVIGDAAILAVFSLPPPNWQVKTFRVDWQPPQGTTLEAHALQLLDPSVYQTSLAYDALNRIKTMRYPRDVGGARKTLLPKYNRAGALESVELDGRTYVERIAYNAKGHRTLIAYGNGVMTRHAYDPKTFRLQRMRTERYTKDGTLTYRPKPSSTEQERKQNLLQDFAYAYDLAGNIVALHDRTSDGGVSPQPDQLDRAFTYDPLYRLLSATGRECDAPLPPPPWDDGLRCSDPTKTRPYTETYEYDPAGNMTRLNHSYFPANGNVSARNRKFVLAPNSNRLAKMTVGTKPYAYAYDPSGNLTSESASRHFEWDHADRMRVYRTQTGNSEPTVHTQYLYDAGGQRVKKLVRKKGQVEVSVYVDGAFEYHSIAKTSATQKNNTLHVMDDQSRIAQVRVGNPLPDDTTPAVKYHLGDHLGSSNVVIDDAGSWINREEYTPYGETSFGSFAGKERDEESRLYYHGARYYAPWLARWISCDPAGPGDGPNLYAAFGCSPLVFRDPTGLQSERQPASTAAAPSSERVSGVCLDYSQIRSDDPRLRAAGAPKMDTREFLRAQLSPLNVPREQGPTLSADTRTPAERMAAKEEFERYDAFLKQFPATPYELYRLYISAEAHAAHDPVRFIAQFGTAKNMPGYRAPTTTATYLRGAPGGSNQPAPITDPSRLLPANAGGPTPRVPRPPGPTVDSRSGHEVGRFIVDPKGNTMIEPVGGRTVGNKTGTFVESQYPNTSPYQQLHGPHKNVPDPHGHGFRPGAGENQRGPSLDPSGNEVPYNTPAAHWPVRK